MTQAGAPSTPVFRRTLQPGITTEARLQTDRLISLAAIELIPERATHESVRWNAIVRSGLPAEVTRAFAFESSPRTRNRLDLVIRIRSTTSKTRACLNPRPSKQLPTCVRMRSLGRMVILGAT